MILLSVGNLNPFNRLVRTVDEWAQSHPQTDIFAQIGETSYAPSHFEYVHNFASEKMRAERFAISDLLVCDLSIDLLLMASRNNLPVLALPRLPIFGEENGITQIKLAQHLRSDAFIQIARDENDLFDLLSMPRKKAPIRGKRKEADALTTSLRQTVREAG